MRENYEKEREREITMKGKEDVKFVSLSAFLSREL